MNSYETRRENILWARNALRNARWFRSRNCPDAAALCEQSAGQYRAAARRARIARCL